MPTRRSDPMSMLRRWLTLDAGNTTLDAMLHELADATARTVARARFAVDGLDGAAFAAFVARVPLDGAAAVAVRRGALDPAFHVLAAAGVTMALVGRDLHCPLPLDYATPHTLGADRWLGALAAHRRHGRALVVDCGSATTVNLVAADGTFRGGPIGPGLRALQSGMQQVTPALPAADLQATPQWPPRSSQAAVDAGTLIGYSGLVERLVAAMLAVAGGPSQELLTGGNAELVVRHGRLQARHEPDLVHQGLLWLATGAGAAPCGR